MTPPSAAIDAIFSRPRDAAAVLFLVEDSSYMVPLWQRLRDSYVPCLLTAIEGANPSTSAEALWMSASERTPYTPPSDHSACRTPRWDDIPTIKFSPHGGTVISPANVTRAVEALSATCGHGPATRHLVIVAALNPTEGVLGPRGTLAWSTVVERLHQEEIRVHLIVRSQSAMDGLTPLYWDLISKGRVYQSFADDTQFAFYLSDFYGATDKGKASAADDRVPNSGLQSTTMSSSGSPSSSVDKPSLVYQLQKMNGMEKKRRSRTRRDQPPANKPGQPYQKSYPHTRTNSSTAQSTSLDPSDRSPSRRKDASRASRVDASSSHFDPPPPRTSPDEYRTPYSSTTSPPRSSSPSPCYPSAGTSSSPGSRNLSPLRASLPMPTPAFDPFQHMAITTQSTPDSLSPSSPGYHELHSYSHKLPDDLRPQYHVSQTVPVDESRLATTQFTGIYGPNRTCWNEYDRQQGRFEPSIYPRSFASYPPAPSGLVPPLTHRSERTSTTSSLPPMSHGLGTPTAESTGDSYFYPGYEDRATGTSFQNIYLADRSSDADPSTTVPYYS